MPERLSEWSRFIDELESDGAMPAVILDSWRRSEAAGVQRRESGFHRVSDEELRSRQQINRKWLSVAQSHIEWLSRAFKHVQHVVYATDRDGIVLAAAGDPDLEQRFALAPGFDWSEARMGTNGAGTALVADRPMAVVGPEHFVDAFGDCTCTAAPIHAPDGSILGALDITTSSLDANPERIFVVAHAAYSISRAVELRESRARYGVAEQRLLAALSASEAGTFRWDPETGRFIDFDDSLKRLLGLEAFEPVPKIEDFLRRVHPDDRARVTAAVNECREGKDLELEHRVVLPDGSTRWLFGRGKMTGGGEAGPGYLVGACMDITGRKQVEEKLADSHHYIAESEGRLATAVELADLGVWEYDPATGRIRGDARWVRILGLSPNETLSMAEAFELIHPEDRARMESRMSAAASAEGGGSFEAEHRLIRADGSCRWLAVRGRTLNPAQGSDYGRFLGTMMDITEQREAQALLAAAWERERQATALLDAIFNAAPIGIGFWDLELRFQRVNAVLANMNGLSAAEHLGKRPDELFPDIEGLDDLLRQWQHVMATGKPLLNVEVRGQTLASSDRERIWMEDFFPVRIDDEVIGLGAVVEEVTDRRRAEEALADSERRYRTLFNSMDEGFCVIEKVETAPGEPLDFRYLEANPAFMVQSGIQDVLGKTIREMAAGDNPQPWIDTYESVLRTGEALRFERSLGRRLLDVYAYPLEDETQRRVAVIFMDVTERKKAEVALLEADRAKDEFLAVLGHELRNPLAPLRTGLDLMEHARTRPALLDSLRPMMDRQLSHLVRLVDDLLDISRISQGRIELQRADIDLNAPVEAAVEQLACVMEERRHDFVVQLSDAPLPILGDFERLTEVISNLLGNAAKYTDPGGTIRVTSTVEDGQAVVRVADTGYGIPPQHLNRLFKLFSQVPEHRQKTGGSGLGIGLALSRQLIDLHGGSIGVESPGLDLGSEFIVRLPLHIARSREPATPPTDPGPIPSRRVLVVDDNDDAAESVRMLLELNRHTVRTAHDGPAALRLLDDFEPEVVLLDLGMPGMSGIDLARRMRIERRLDDVVLVAVTGWGQDEDRRRTREAGFDHHLTKPVDWALLAPILANPSSSA